MDIEYSKHWLRKKRVKKKDITDDKIEYAIRNSRELKDKHWEDVLNAISRIPPSGRILKVVYKRVNQKIFIITAYWLD
ncbi:MAG: DUF4258 domain-containing protein [archaeon]